MTNLEFTDSTPDSDTVGAARSKPTPLAEPLDRPRPPATPATDAAPSPGTVARSPESTAFTGPTDAH